MKRNIAPLLVLLLLLLMAVTACSASPSATAPGAPEVYATVPPGGEDNIAGQIQGFNSDILETSIRYGGIGSEPGQAPSPADGGAPVQNTSAAVRESKLIRKARLDLQTLTFTDAVTALENLTSQMGGYLENSSINGGEYYEKNAMRSAYFVVRVPRDQYDAFLSGAGDVGHIVSKSQTQEDIGELYYGTELRLKTQHIKQERLLNLLNKAELMEDIIALETALSETEYQIEQHTSSLKRYNALVDYATIEVQLNEVLKLEDSPAQTLNTSTRVVNAFDAGFRNLGESIGNLVVWCAFHFVGVLAFLAVVAVCGMVAVRKLRSRRKAMVPQTPESPKDKGENKSS